MRRGTLLFIIGVLLISCAQAAVYYVTNSGSGTKDGSTYENSWSLAQFESTSYWGSGVDKISPGDTVYFSGKFGKVRVRGSGSQDKYVHIIGNDGIHPRAEITIPYQNNGIEVVDKSWLDISEFYIEGNGWRGLWVTNLNLDSPEFTHIRLHGLTLRCHDVQSCLYVEGKGNYIYIYNNDLLGFSLDSYDGLKAGASRGKPGPMHHVWIYNNTITDFYHVSISTSCLEGCVGLSYVWVINNTMTAPHRAYSRGYSILRENSVDKLEYFYVHHNIMDSFRAPNQLSGNYLYFYSNILSNHGNVCGNIAEYPNPMGDCPEPIMGYPGGDYPSGFGCHSYWGTGQALVLGLNAAPHNMYIYNNIFYNSAESALQFRKRSGVLDNIHIQNNIFYENAIAAKGTWTPVGKDTGYCYDSEAWVWNMAPGDDIPPGSQQTWTDYPIFFGSSAVFRNSEIRNNIIYNEGWSDIYGEYYGVDSYKRAFSVQGMESVLSSPDLVITGNIQADPMFVDPIRGDFRLMPDSPAIDAGLDLGLTEDFFGNAITGIPDIGVYEYQDNQAGQNLVSHWKFEGNAFDSAGNNDAQITGTASYSLGVDGQGINLDGSYAAAADDSSLDLQAYTLAGWVKIQGPSDSGLQGIFGKNGAYRVFCTNSDPCDLRIQHYSRAAGSFASIINQALSWKKWHHVAVTFKRHLVRVYIDGQLRDSASWDDTLANSQSAFYLGTGQSNMYYLNGSLDDVRLYDYELTAQEINNLYKQHASYHPADTDYDTCVDTSELIVYMNRWKASNSDVSMAELMGAISEWKDGC